ncbi:FAD-dependent oxidoreductase [Modestobacter sp. NPDC049651]|uniref:FAD-dependent oxidoreductase n=1 Tax=unclassified Modestobacter TaxID=2643866 RepID=UPI003409E051
MFPADSDVVVVGGGPTGLLLAGDLARAGRSVTVLERHPAASPLSRAFGVHARTLELLDQRGLADELLATGRPVATLRLLGRAGVDLSRLPTAFPYVLITPQHHVDALLGRYAAAQGATVVRGAEVTGLDQGPDGVTLRVRTGDGEQAVTARYAVGADGAHSTVRGLVGLPFPGAVVLRSIMLADAELADPPADGIAVDAGPDGFAFVAPYGDGRFRLITWDRRNQAAPDAPLTGEDVRRSLVRAAGTDFGLGRVTWVSRFSSDERQVPCYRAGRVFLAGDAAHVHTPAGGQGMNTGIQDAANLAWKLAAVLGGAAPDLLDGYDAERHPVGRTVLRTSGTTMRMMTVHARPLRALRAAALAVVPRVRPLADRAAGTFSGVSIGYPRGAGDHRLVGTRVGDLPLRAPAGRLAVALRTGRWVLVLPAGASLAERAAASAAAGERAEVVQRADAGPGLLVRPDGYAAWAGGAAWAGDATGAGWQPVLDRWSPRRPVPAAVG